MSDTNILQFEIKLNLGFGWRLYVNVTSSAICLDTVTFHIQMSKYDICLNNVLIRLYFLL